MVFLYRCFQFLQPSLPVFFRTARVFVALKHLDYHEVFSILQKIGDHAMSDGSGVQFPFRKEIPKSLHQIIDVIGLDGFLPENEDERRLTYEPCLYCKPPFGTPNLGGLSF